MRWWNWVTVDGVADYYREPREEYMRVFVNYARQRLVFCGAGEDGMCKLDELLKNQRYARNDGFRDFKKCNHTGGEQAPTCSYPRLGFGLLCTLMALMVTTLFYFKGKHITSKLYNGQNRPSCCIILVFPSPHTTCRHRYQQVSVIDPTRY
ncbi:hypothetical protein BJ322DRAFT_494855 [Thelephora terrestris]|uniref:Uncharacterized protein n=1 Tax=Thelephora terrestris TaxID=56493 RepID=A0A9P6L0U7_9AGAM|nr:hypothetical protein BJ322DRAFT_494855 [Thelephora terrestris]